MTFIEQYFIQPILEGGGYNIYNTAVYAVLLLAFVFIIKALFDFYNIKPDEWLWEDLVPFIIFAGAVRAMVDAAMIPRHFLLVTPGLYFTTAALAAVSIIADKKMKRHITQIVGRILGGLALFMVLIYGRNWNAFLLILISAAVIFAVVYLSFAFIPLLRKNKHIIIGKNKQLVFAHILDSVATVFIISYLCIEGLRYSEQHVIPSLMFTMLPIWTFIIVKIALVMLAIHYIEKEVKDYHWQWMFKFAILVLGLGPAVRNILSALLNSNFC